MVGRTLGPSCSLRSYLTMGNCASEAMTEEQLKSNNIDLEMSRAQKDENEKIKLLLLGEFAKF